MPDQQLGDVATVFQFYLVQFKAVEDLKVIRTKEKFQFYLVQFKVCFSFSPTEIKSNFNST